MPSSNRDRAVRAAVEIVGTRGLHALTHRAVDTQAGLPLGTTSNYFRTRVALLQGVVGEMVEAELPRLADRPSPTSVDELADELVDLFGFLTGPSRVMTSARLALFVEAGHDEILRETLARGRAAFADVLHRRFADLQAPDPRLATQIVAVCFEGLFLHVLGGHDSVDAPRIIRAAVRSAVTENM